MRIQRFPSGKRFLTRCKPRAAVGTNTNLGTLLLVVPLAKVPPELPLAAHVGEVLRQLTPEDARQVYAAINHANPGGMGKVDEGDVAAEPPADLIAAMRLAAERDMVARQYATDFADIFETVVPLVASMAISIAPSSFSILAGES